MSLTALFCSIDDFGNDYLVGSNKRSIALNNKKRNRDTQLSISEMMTMVILLDQNRI